MVGTVVRQTTQVLLLDFKTKKLKLIFGTVDKRGSVVTVFIR
jgi:hypothetical protein